MSEPPISSGPPPPPRHDPRFKSSPSISGCGGFLLVLLGLVMLLPGACVIVYVYNDPRELFAPGAGVLWTFLMVSAAGVALIIVMVRLGTRRSGAGS